METETLSNYEQAQDNHVLDTSMDINIPRNDEETISKEINSLTPGVRLKESISDNTEGRKTNCESSENKENENDCDRNAVTDQEDHLENDNDSTNDSEDGTGVDKETIESEEKSPIDDKINDVEVESNNSVNGGALSDEEPDPLDGEKSPSDEEKDPLESGEKSPSNEEEKDPLDSGEKSPSNDEEKDPLNEEERDPLSEKETEKENNEDEADRGTPKDEDPLEIEHTDKESRKGADGTSIADSNDKDAPTDDGDKEKEDITDKEKEDTGEDKNDSDKTEKENEESSEDKTGDVTKDCPLLKETLTKSKDNDCEQKDVDGENGMEDIDMDDDFDPSLLCPDIAMEVDEAPVITSNDNLPADGNKSPLLYEPVFSTYVDEMTGAEVTFNLTAEEHKMRQETYGEANPIQYTRIHCTACNVHLGSALDAQSNRFVHPLLKVLICKDCYHFYTSGEFEKDEDGSELYCRWCGQGGQVICCSSCEMVFCKKCIRINFGRKKLTEIRDSDEWLCFRCDPLQLTSLRVHCAEFMEYVRREISRAATLENATSFMTTDYTQCCLSQKKKYVDPHPGEPKRKKRKSSLNDPDYDPRKDRSVSPQPGPSTATPATPATTDATSQKLVPILPKPADPNLNAGTVTQAQNSNVFKVGNTTFRPKIQFSSPRPRVQVISPTSTNAVRASSSGPGYIKIMPGGIRVTPSPSRNQPGQSFVSTPRQSFQHRPIRPAASTSCHMKHEWFEKTVRAAARVNSNLSYTLTQLNRAQATATSVEALAVVHNKLQEILSTSINSLIQIRKNLRTEFIAGIKNIRFPPKTQPQPSTSSQDDDVIFVSPAASPVPPPLLSTNSPITSVNLPPSVSLTKRTSTPSTPSTPSAPSTSLNPVTPSTSNNDKPKVFLRVKSLTALQNVPSECITIPDDPLPPPPPLTPIQKCSEEITIIDNSPEKEVKKDDEDINNEKGDNEKNEGKSDEKNDEEGDEKNDEKGDEKNDEKSDEKNDEKSAEKNDEKSDEKNGENDESEVKMEVTPAAEESGEAVAEESQTETADGVKEVEGSKETRTDDQDGPSLAFNMNESPHEMKKMLNTKVYITRSEEIDALVKRSFGLMNGDASE